MTRTSPLWIKGEGDSIVTDCESSVEAVEPAAFVKIRIKMLIKAATQSLQLICINLLNN